MSHRDKSGMDNTYITTLSSQGGGLVLNSPDDNNLLEDQDENGNIISEKDEDLEDLSCSQFIKQTEFSLNKEDMHSTSRFDSEYIHNALQEGFNESKDVSSDDDDDEEEDQYDNEMDENSDVIEQQCELNHQYNNREFKQQQRSREDNYTPFSSFNRNIGMISHQQFDGHSLNLSLLNQNQMQSQSEYMNELVITKNTNFSLESENQRLKEELEFLKQQHQTNSDLIRMQTEYQQIKFDEKMQEALRVQRDKYEGKINNYKEQIKMYQTTIENIRVQYKDKNQKLYEVVAKLEKEKQELMDKNIDLIKTKIQNKLAEENNLNNSEHIYHPQKQGQDLNSNQMSFSSNGMMNNTVNLVNLSFDNLNFTGSFSQQLASMKQNQKPSLEKLQDLKADSICLSQSGDQQKMESFTISKMKDESFAHDYFQGYNSTLRNLNHQQHNNSNQTSNQDFSRVQRPLDHSQHSEMKINSQNSSKNAFQLTRLSKQIQQDDEANTSIAQDINNKFSYYEEEIYQDKIKKSLHQGESLLKNNLSMNAGNKQERQSPNTSQNQMQLYKNNYDKRSYSIDSSVMREIRKSYSTVGDDKINDSKYDSSHQRYQHQDYLSNNNMMLKKRNSFAGPSRKNSFNESMEIPKYTSNSKILKNNFMKTQNSAITTATTNPSIASNFDKNKRKGSNSQRTTSLTQTYSNFNNKENTQLNSNNLNKSSYMKQTQSSKQKKAVYKIPDYLALTVSTKGNNNGNNSNSLERKVKKSQTFHSSSNNISTKQKKQQYPLCQK